MKVLMLSTDENILKEGTEARRRMAEYSGLFDELRIVVLARQNPLLSSPSRGRINPATQCVECGIKVRENLFVYSTNSANKFFALFNAYKIGKEILKDNNVTPRLHSANNACSELSRTSPRAESRGNLWIITSQDPFELGLVGYFLKKNFGVPLQLQVHTDFLSPYFWRESLKNKMRVIIAKWLLPKADGVRVVSERIKYSITSNLRSCGDLRLEVLPIFVDTEKIRNAPVKIDLHKKYPQFDFIILMASRISPEKNIGLAIKAMEEVVEQYPKAGLVIVGDGKENKILNIKNKKLGENIKIEPWTDDLASYYKTADAFLLTSNYEGYGRTVVEAMAAGLPIAMTDVGVAGELVKDGQNGFIFPVGDSRACAEALKKLIARDTALYPAELLKKDELLPGLKKSLESLGG